MNENNGHIPLPNNDNKGYLPLYDFFIALKRNNFLVTPLQIADANRIIEKYAHTVNNELELCNYLAPVFANSAEEQIQFRQLFEEYFTPLQTPATGKMGLALQAIKKEDKTKKKSWRKLILVALAAIALLAIITWILAPNLGWFGDRCNNMIKPQFTLDTELSFAGSGKPDKQVDVTVLPDTINDKTSYKVTFNWGDSSAVDTLTHHVYSKAGNFNITAYVDVLCNGAIEFTDTLNETVVICATPATIKIEKSFAGDSIVIGTAFTLNAIVNGKQPDSIQWSDSGGELVETGKRNTLKTTINNPGVETFYLHAYYKSSNACDIFEEISFYIYDTTPKPAVIFRPAKNANPIMLTYAVRGYWFYLLGAAAMLFLFLSGFYALKRSRLKKQKSDHKEDIHQRYDKMIRSFSGKSGSADIPFHNKNFLPVPEQELGAIARQMRKRINDDVTYMHVEKTISKAILHAGFFEPVIATRTQQSEFLVLISQKTPNDQQTKLFDFLLELLKKQNVLIDKFYYKTSPLVCYHENENTETSLEKLSEKYPEHILLIFGDASELIYPDYPAIIKEYMALLNRWQYKAIMTPVSFNDWGNKEKKVLLQQLPVLPVDISGQLLLMQKLFVEELNIVAVLNQYSDEFYEAAMVDFEDLEELADYCAEAGWAKVSGADKYSNILFQWIAALAVYPKISWEITLAIGKAILDKAGLTQQLNYTNLLRLARISWMQAGRFPDFTRLNLLKKLSLENEIIARETILQVINEIPETELNSSHFAFEESELQRLINEFNLYAYDPVKYEAYQHAKELFAKLNKDELITDVTAKSYLENPDLNWQTLISEPTENKGTGTEPKNISLQHYLHEEPADSPKAKIYLWATALSSLLFLASMLGLVLLGILAISGNYSLPPFTHKAALNKKIQINYYKTAADSVTKNITVSIDSATADFSNANDYTEDSTRKMLTLGVAVNDSAKEVIINWNEFPVFDSLMVIRFDEYDLELTKNKPVPAIITANLMLQPGCKAAFNIYKNLILSVDSNIHVKETNVPANADPRTYNKNNNNWCINRISYGAAVDKKKIDSIIEGFFINYGISLRIDQAMYTAGVNEIVLYNGQYTASVTKPVVYVLVSDSSIMPGAQKFKSELESNGFKVKPVALSNFSYNSDISYYRNLQQFNANKINSLYKKYYPALKVQAHLAKFPPGQALADTNAIVVWIKMLEKPKPLNGLSINRVHYTSPNKVITGDFYIDPKTKRWAELNNDPLNKGRAVINPMTVVSQSENTINLTSDNAGHYITIDLQAGIINVAGRKSYDILSVTDGKNTRTYSPKNELQNSALEFDGKSGYVQMGDFNLGTSDFTLEAWIKPSGSRSYFITNRSDEMDQEGNWFGLSFSSGNVINFEMARDQFKSFLPIVGKAQLTTNAWCHIAVTRAGNMITLYVNGNKDIVVSDVGARNLTTGKNIGRVGAMPAYQYFNGSMDEVRIWELSRTQSQIRANMLKEISPKTPGLSGYYKFNETSGNFIIDETGRNTGTIRGNLKREQSSIPGFATGVIISAPGGY